MSSMETQAKAQAAESPASEIEPSGEECPTLSPAEAAHAARRGLRIFCPHKMVDSVTHVDPIELVKRGIKGLILDLDNTLVVWRGNDIAPEVMAWLESVKAAGIKLCILSNSVLSKRSERIAERLGCPNVRKARKPSTSGFHRAMQFMTTTPATTAIVGDQMFTDIWGGNRVGIYTIMVRPIHHSEFVYTRYVSRPPERFLIRLFKRRGHL